MSPYDTQSIRIDNKYRAKSSVMKLIYEIKPVIYFLFSVVVLKSPAALNLVIKFSTFGVLLFAVYITHRRFENRGVYARFF